MNDQSKQYQQLIAKCWANDALKKRLLGDTGRTLKAEGIEVPEGFTVNVVENTAHSFTLVIPERPTDLSDENHQSPQDAMYDQIPRCRQLIAKCWAGDDFKRRLLGDTAGTLKAEGIEVPEGFTIDVVENTTHTFTLVIPERQTELSDDDLADIAGGGIITPQPCYPGSPNPLCPPPVKSRM